MSERMLCNEDCHGLCPVKVAGVFITRKCNLSCSYCKVTRKVLDRELTNAEWISALSILDRLKFERVVFLGGEPTLVPGIVDIIDYAVNKTSLDIAIVSNSVVSFEMLSDFAKIGLQKYSTSIDSITNQGYDSSSTLKSNKALQALLQMKALDVPVLTGYLVLNRKSAGQVEHVARLLTSFGINTYLIPLHHGPEEFWENRSDNISHAFQNGDEGFLKKFSEHLINLKNNGVMIANSDDFLRSLHRYAIKLNWHCAASTSELRIDADGKLMCCNDIRGENSEIFSIFDLTSQETFTLFQNERRKDAEKCPGCFWPSHFQAMIKRCSKIQKGIGYG